jgi:drug/metabolite transporter (DMT)-like permease
MTNRHLHWREWVPDFVLLSVLWGSSFLFMREGAHEFGPFPTSWVRVTLAALILTPVLVWRREVPVLVVHWRQAMSAGVLNAGIPFACYAYALMHINTGLTSILNATTPLFGALIAWFWLGDKLTATRALGLALGFTGVVLLASDVPGGISFKEGGSGLAVAACLVATFCYGISGSFTKRYLQNVPSLVTTTGSLWGASLGLGIPALLTWPDAPPQLARMGSAWHCRPAVHGLGVCAVLSVDDPHRPCARHDRHLLDSCLRQFAGRDLFRRSCHPLDDGLRRGHRGGHCFGLWFGG